MSRLAAPADGPLQAAEVLRRALEVSEEILELAEAGQVEDVIRLDAERLRLIKSVGQALTPMN
jgi:hypothetical protein